MEGFYFLGLRKAQDVQILGALFATNKVPEKIEHKRMRGRGQNKIKTRIERSNFANFWPIFVFWALLKIQSAIIPSILGVRGSSPDSRKLSPTPFNNKKVKT